MGKDIPLLGGVQPTWPLKHHRPKILHVPVGMCMCTPRLAQWLMDLGSQPQENLKVQKIDRLCKD